MKESEFWGTYYRSTSRGGKCDRIASLFGDKKKYKNTNTNEPSNAALSDNIAAAKAGTIPSPWKFDRYKMIFQEDPTTPEATDNSDSCLYDSLLVYKNSICEFVVKKFNTEKNQSEINVYFEND